MYSHTNSNEATYVIETCNLDYRVETNKKNGCEPAVEPVEHRAPLARCLECAPEKEFEKKWIQSWNI